MKEKGSVDGLEIKFKTKSGVLRDSKLFASIVEIEGEPHILSTIWDITRTKKAEELLKAEQSKYRELFENMQECVAVYSSPDAGENFFILDFNKSAERLEKVKKNDILGKNVKEVFPGVEKFGLLKVFQDVWKTGRSVSFLAAMYYDERISGYRDNYVYRLPSGDIVAVYNDINETKKQERLLIEAKNQLALAVSGSGAGLWDLKVKTGEMIISKTCAELLGYSLEELTPLTLKAWNKLCKPEDLKKVKEAQKKHFSRETADYRITQRVAHKDGEWRWLSTRGKVNEWDKDGKPVRMTGIHIDVTGRVLAEQQRLLSSKVLSILNSNLSLDNLIENFVKVIKKETGFNAVGIRLKKDNDFPYYCRQGFSKEFLITENSLVSRAQDGSVCKDKNGNISLECICGLVISGKADLKNPLFTKRGSAWTNNSLSLLNLTAEEDSRRNPGNSCVHEGYLSLAVIPIRADREIIGLLQINHKKKNKLSRELIQCFEDVGSIIGIGLVKKFIEEKVKENEFKYKSLFENANNAIIIADAGTGEILDANNKAETLLGRKREEIIGMNRIKLHPPEKSEFYSRQFVRHIKQKIVSNEKGEILRKDGKHVHVYISCSVMELAGKRIIQGVFQDVTDIEKTEEKLVRSENKYRSLFEHINSAIIIIDIRTSTILEANGYSEILFGRSRKELIGMNWFKLHHKKQAKDYAETFKKIIKFKNILDKELLIVRKDGTDACVMISTKVEDIYGKKVIRCVLNDVTVLKNAEKSLKLSHDKIEKALYSTVAALASTVEAKDPYTSGHQKRVSELSTAIALEMGYSADRIMLIKTAATVHDIGKIQVPSEILSKPGKISKIELELIKTHVQYSYDLLKNIEFPWPIAEIVYQHHERIDGTGYPRGLKGNQIMPEVKIITVADVVEAMMSHRPYRAALGVKKALEEIKKNRKKFYDPDVVAACIKIFKENNFQFIGEQ